MRLERTGAYQGLCIQKYTPSPMSEGRRMGLGMGVVGKGEEKCLGIVILTSGSEMSQTGPK